MSQVAILLLMGVMPAQVFCLCHLGFKTRPINPLGRSLFPFKRLLPRFKRSFEGRREAVVAPIELIPPEMQEVRLFNIWKGWFYCIEFRKPLGEEVA